MRNASTSSPFGQFQAYAVVDGIFEGERVRIGTANVTSTTGVENL